MALGLLTISVANYFDLIGGYFYLANQVREYGFDFAKSIAAFVLQVCSSTLLLQHYSHS
jgi:hypothetical protein